MKHGCRQLAACCLLLLLWACTEQELYKPVADPHSGEVHFGYDWTAMADFPRPDSMAVMAVRVINHYKRGMIMSTENLRGHYFYNAPDNVVAWIDPSIVPPEPPPPVTENNYEIDPTDQYNGGDPPSAFEPEEEQEEEPETPRTAIEVDHFRLPNGTYKFYAMAIDTTLYDHMYTNVPQYLEADGTGTQYNEVEMVYKNRTDSLMEDDKNQGFDYIKRNYPPIIIDRLELMEVPDQSKLDVTFKPRPLTQNIDINFNIEKDITNYHFTIDSVWCEVSGIPSKCTLFDGHLFLQKTNKMQFTTKLTNESGTVIDDQDDNTKLRVHANINVLSILHSSKPTDLTGPGILQIEIKYKYTKNDDGADKEIIRRVFGKLNLYHVLKQANLIKYSDDLQYATKSCDHAVLDIPGIIKISPEGVISGDESGGGFSNWEQCGDAKTDKGDDIELY